MPRNFFPQTAELVGGTLSGEGGRKRRFLEEISRQEKRRGNPPLLSGDFLFAFESFNKAFAFGKKAEQS